MIGPIWMNFQGLVWLRVPAMAVGWAWSLKMFGVRTWMSILKIEKHRCANDMRKKITEMEKAHENIVQQCTVYQYIWGIRFLRHIESGVSAVSLRIPGSRALRLCIADVKIWRKDLQERSVRSTFLPIWSCFCCFPPYSGFYPSDSSWSYLDSKSQRRCQSLMHVIAGDSEDLFVTHRLL